VSESAAFALKLRHPVQHEQRPPCQDACPACGDIRSWIGTVARREQLGLSLEDALDQAWRTLVERNPFPATLGRICPHPCESGCNRAGLDAGVSINAMERFVGDWGLERGLALPRLHEGGRTGSVGVVGAGPAGLSFAYQMARRGYPVTVYDAHDRPGGMLTWGIPGYRLPREVIDGEIARIVDLGVRLELGVVAGSQLDADELYRRHDIVFLGIGAQRDRRLGIDGEDGPGVWSAIEYLALASQGRAPVLGERVVVVGGGNTAVDAARTARRSGSDVTLAYRRTREEMPASAEEVADAVHEGVHVLELVAPLFVRREGGLVQALQLQRMALGERDASGRRAPVPLEGESLQLPADAILVAVSQVPDWKGLETDPIAEEGDMRLDGEHRATLAGGDAVGVGIASRAIGHGRMAAERAHAALCGLTDAAKGTAAASVIRADEVRTDLYPQACRHETPRREGHDPLVEPDAECFETMSREAFLAEVGRCLSCGQCFGCGRCAMYCNAGAYTPAAHPHHGGFFDLNISVCEGCGKCIELCPCGFLQAVPG
jgi:NADPH-dependent glutamate synthase beta subunit-like oxidoreductase/Pyruvate/2-oxoacid:ferredoxin oxidoreductase delta subunit